jgi:hypothetical protein
MSDRRAPKTATTASPMNFSTEPPKRSSSDRRCAWYGDRIASTSSGSSVSERAVKPTRSAKSTLTTLRSRRGPLPIVRVYEAAATSLPAVSGVKPRPWP